MEFKNGYNLLYQKLKAVYASKTGRPNADDQPVDFGLTEEEIAKIKLVYETKDSIVASYSNIPTKEDLSVTVTVNGEPVIGPSGDTPTALFKLKAGDKFVDLHFDTSTIPNKDDFNWIEDDGLISIIAAFKWHQRGSSEDVDGDAFAAQYLPAGTIESEEEGRYNKDIFIIMDFEGNIIYVNDAKEMNEFLGKGDYPDLEDGWQVGSFKEFIEKYEIDWDLSKDSYGELIAQVPGENDYIPDYTQAANGKYYGFKQSDYYKQPGPTPPPGPLYTMEAFEIGDDLGIGAKIHFDTSKSSELESLISGYDYDDSGMNIMFYTERANLMIIAADLNKVSQGAISGYILQINNGQDMMGVVYSTVDAEIQGKTLKAGWNYIEDGGYMDSDNNITTIYGEHNMVIEGSINENSNPELWNGVLFGKAVLVGE